MLVLLSPSPPPLPPPPVNAAAVWRHQALNSGLSVDRGVRGRDKSHLPVGVSSASTAVSSKSHLNKATQESENECSQRFRRLMDLLD